jgi:hypothetical protein
MILERCPRKPGSRIEVIKMELPSANDGVNASNLLPSRPEMSVFAVKQTIKSWRGESPLRTPPISNVESPPLIWRKAHIHIGVVANFRETYHCQDHPRWRRGILSARYPPLRGATSMIMHHDGS